MALEAHGVCESEVYWVVLPFDQQELAIMHGHVDAIGVLQPHTVRPRNNHELRTIMTAYDVFSARQFTTHVFNSVWAEHNPELVEAFVSAVADAAEWIEGNQTAAREIVSRHTGVDVRYIENYYFQPNARVNMDDAAFWLDYMRHIGLVTADWLTVEDFATNRFNLREVD
jgi:ABC-type nitrate/sulfonate/bicarbonate transport system substrate-binding protein